MAFPLFISMDKARKPRVDGLTYKEDKYRRRKDSKRVQKKVRQLSREENPGDRYYDLDEDTFEKFSRRKS